MKIGKLLICMYFLNFFAIHYCLKLRKQIDEQCFNPNLIKIENCSNNLTNLKIDSKSILCPPGKFYNICLGKCSLICTRKRETSIGKALKCFSQEEALNIKCDREVIYLRQNTTCKHNEFYNKCTGNCNELCNNNEDDSNLFFIESRMSKYIESPKMLRDITQLKSYWNNMEEPTLIKNNDFSNYQSPKVVSALIMNNKMQYS